MVDFGQATYIDGTVVSGSELRRNTQRDAGDGSGVVRPGDLKVTQMDVPGAGVKIAVGDALVQSRAPGAERETYGFPLVTAQNYLGDAGGGIPGTGSSVPSGGRRDMVFVEILDPGLPTFYTPQESWPAGQSVKVSIIQNVPSTARSVADVPALANVTGYALALITYPASTATITNTMITDLRMVQKLRSWRVFRTVDLSATQQLSATTAFPAGGQAFPLELSEDDRNIDIPDWATHVNVLMILGSVRMPAGSTAAGTYWVQIGGNAHPDATRSTQGSFNGGGQANESKDTWMNAGKIRIPDSMRGTRQGFFIKARLSAAVGAALRPELNTLSSVLLDVEFLREPV